MKNTSTLPTQDDFDPTRLDLDAGHAWEMFGGLSIDEAHTRFIDHPEFYQEDFMFMGGAAFAFYFPVIERYILEVQLDTYEDEADALWILAHAINAQFESNTAPLVKPIADRIRDLTVHVLTHLEQYASDQAGRDRLDSAWASLAETLQKVHG